MNDRECLLFGWILKIAVGFIFFTMAITILMLIVEAIKHPERFSQPVVIQSHQDDDDGGPSQLPGTDIWVP